MRHERCSATAVVQPISPYAISDVGDTDWYFERNPQCEAAAALREALCIRPLVTRMPRSARTAEVNAKAATRVAVDEPSSNGALNGIR